MKKALTKKSVTKMLWQLLVNIIAVAISLIAYYTTQNVGWAAAVLPPAKIAAELATRLINDHFIR